MNFSLLTMFYLGIFLSVLVNCFNGRGPNPALTTTHLLKLDSTPVNKQLLLELVNNARKKGCTCGDTYFPPAPPVEWDATLEKAAMEHSQDMARRNYFRHITPEGTGAGSRIREAGYNWRNYGENIGLGYRNEEEVMNGWLHSPGHCKNIMNKAYREMGVGRDGNYWTQDFGSK